MYPGGSESSASVRPGVSGITAGTSTAHSRVPEPPRRPEGTSTSASSVPVTSLVPDISRSAAERIPGTSSQGSAGPTGTRSKVGSEGKERTASLDEADLYKTAVESSSGSVPGSSSILAEEEILRDAPRDRNSLKRKVMLDVGDDPELPGLFDETRMPEELYARDYPVEDETLTSNV